jgi:hypothetical protein
VMSLIVVGVVNTTTRGIPRLGLRIGSLRDDMRLFASRSRSDLRSIIWSIAMMRCRRRRIVRRQRNVYMLLGGSAETNKCEKKRRQSQSRLHFLTKLRSLPSSRMKYHLFRKCKSVKTRLRIKWKGAFFHPPILPSFHLIHCDFSVDR